jgi:hypothetical protein
MRLLKLPVTVVRVPVELGVGAAKGAVKFAQDLVGGGEETAGETPRQAPPPRRRRTSTRSGNGRARTGTAGKSRAGTSRARTSRARASATAAPPAPAPESTTEPATAAPTAEATATPPAEAPVEPVPVAPVPEAEPAHVSEEPELVAEMAEAGAEDGAGAEVAVEEPWSGYDEMAASDIEDRLVTEGPEAAAAVSLYEAARKGRASVLEAASRNMTS